MTVCGNIVLIWTSHSGQLSLLPSTTTTSAVAGKVTIGLPSHWHHRLGSTSICGLNWLMKGDEHPSYAVARNMAAFTFILTFSILHCKLVKITRSHRLVKQPVNWAPVSSAWKRNTSMSHDALPSRKPFEPDVGLYSDKTNALGRQTWRTLAVECMQMHIMDLSLSLSK